MHICVHVHICLFGREFQSKLESGQGQITGEILARLLWYIYNVPLLFSLNLAIWSEGMMSGLDSKLLLLQNNTLITFYNYHHACTDRKGQIER